MAVNKRKKNSRQHGSHTHGWGTKKHRGAGHRGGRGMAGTGKRAGAIKPSFFGKHYLGKLGFKKKNPLVVKAINLHYLENHLNLLIKTEKATVKGNKYIIDLSKMGYNKLLSKGIVSNKFEIIVSAATEKAIEKVEKAGGSVKINSVKSVNSEKTE